MNRKWRIGDSDIEGVVTKYHISMLATLFNLKHETTKLNTSCCDRPILTSERGGQEVQQYSQSCGC